MIEIDSEIRFGCCFCGAAIEPPQDPKGVILNWGDDASDDDWQQWWAHLDCFVDSLHPSARHFAWEDELPFEV